MVTSRRQIVREEDRYGGYTAEADSVEKTEVSSGERVISNNILKMRAEHTETEEVQAPAEKAEARDEKVIVKPVIRPERTSYGRAAVSGYDRTISPSRPKRISDVMPEVQRREKEETVSIVKEQKLTAATKRLLTIYLVAVVAVVAAVIATGIIAGGLQSEVGALETSVETSSAILNDQLAEMQEWIDGIGDKASDLGMVEIDDVDGTYGELVEGTPTEDTNGIFDGIRDWVNSVFGG